MYAQLHAVPCIWKIESGLTPIILWSREKHQEKVNVEKVSWLLYDNSSKKGQKSGLGVKSEL